MRPATQSGLLAALIAALVLVGCAVQPKMSEKSAVYVDSWTKRVVWQTWTRDRVFPTLLYEANLKTASTPPAVALARKMGIDVVVVGKFTYIMSGGTRGDTGVSFTFDVIDARSGERLWSMAHSGMMQTGLTDDYIIFAKQNRMPPEPVSAVTATLAMDMGGPMTNWNYGYKAPPPAGPNPAPPAPAPAAGS